MNNKRMFFVLFPLLFTTCILNTNTYVKCRELTTLKRPIIKNGLDSWGLHGNVKDVVLDTRTVGSIEIDSLTFDTKGNITYWYNSSMGKYFSINYYNNQGNLDSSEISRKFYNIDTIKTTIRYTYDRYDNLISIDSAGFINTYTYCDQPDHIIAIKKSQNPNVYDSIILDKNGRTESIYQFRTDSKCPHEEIYKNNVLTNVIICNSIEIYKCEYDLSANVLSAKLYDSTIGFYTITYEYFGSDQMSNWNQRYIESSANKYITTQNRYITYY